MFTTVNSGEEFPESRGAEFLRQMFDVSTVRSILLPRQRQIVEDARLPFLA